MSHARHMMNALTCNRGRFRKAWLMFLASYSYTRAYDGEQMSDDPTDVIHFSRWYAFKGALACGLPYLWSEHG